MRNTSASSGKNSKIQLKNGRTWQQHGQVRTRIQHRFSGAKAQPKWIHAILVVIMAVIMTMGLAAVSQLISSSNILLETESVVIAADLAYYTSGQSGDNVYWTFDPETGVLEFSGTGPTWQGRGIIDSAPHDKVTTVKINEGVTEAYFNWAFEMPNLVDMRIPSTLIEISVARYGVQSYHVDENNPVFSSEDGILYNKDKTVIHAFPNKDPRPTFTVKANIVDVRSALLHTRNLTAIYAEEGNAHYSSVDGVLFNKEKTEIVAYPNGNPRQIYTIPAAVRLVRTNVFLWANKLTDIRVEDGNNFYSSIDGVLFNKDKTELWQYPNAKTGDTYEIPNGVMDIKPSSFYSFEDSLNLIFPKSVTKIELEPINNVRYNFTFHCYEGSAAHYYALEHGVKYSLLDADDSDVFTLISGKCGDFLEYEYNTLTHEFNIRGTGAMWEHPSWPRAYNMSEVVESLIIDDGVTSISEWAFSRDFADRHSESRR